MLVKMTRTFNGAPSRREVALAFGAALRNIRKQHRVSQARIGELCDVDPKYWSLLERGGRHPTLWTLLRIARGLELSTLVLVTRTEKELGRITGSGVFKGDLQEIGRALQALYPGLALRETKDGWVLEAREVTKK